MLAIDGPAAGGKSTLAHDLAQFFPQAAVVSLDDFVTPLKTQRPADYEASRGPAHLRLGDCVEEVLQPLKRNAPAQYAALDWSTDQISVRRRVEPANLVIFEGVYAGCRRLRPYVDAMIWMGDPEPNQLSKIIARDGPSLIAHWCGIWLPTEAQYFAKETPWDIADLRLEVDG